MTWFPSAPVTACGGLACHPSLYLSHYCAGVPCSYCTCPLFYLPLIVLVHYLSSSHCTCPLLYLPLIVLVHYCIFLSFDLSIIVYSSHCTCPLFVFLSQYFSLEPNRIRHAVDVYLFHFYELFTKKSSLICCMWRHLRPSFFVASVSG
jgi:hypothetical protein